MEKLKVYNKLIVDYLKDIYSGYKPSVERLYEPVFYSLEGGKKLRPASVLLTTEVFGGNQHDALVAAFAVEMFHNFTLLHDDVMDNSPLRRNRQTVQAKWNVNQAILSGDAMIILVYQKLLQLPTKKLVPIMQLMNKTALEVCEGQQLDMDFETYGNVTLEQYTLMIKLKTAVLLATALAMGAIVSETSQQNIDAVYEFGINLGLAFQIQDDYFDTFGNTETFGKQVGNDIVTNKKTYLYISALSKADKDSYKRLFELYTSQHINPQIKVDEVIHLFKKLGVDKIAENAIKEYFAASLKSLERITNIEKSKLQMLYDFADLVLNREK